MILDQGSIQWFGVISISHSQGQDSETFQTKKTNSVDILCNSQPSVPVVVKKPTTLPPALVFLSPLNHPN